MIERLQTRAARSLRARIVAVALAPSALLAIAFIGALAALAAGVGAELTRAGSAVARASLERVVTDFRVTSEAVHGELGRRVDASLRVAQDVLARAAMDAVEAAIGELRSSAERTSQIIKDVGEISFQTHLLGLNAAVEAARAGQAGAGFAVVASEVRALAGRAKEAAAKTEALLQRSVEETEAGAARTRAAATTLRSIVGAVEEVSGAAAEIAGSARDGASAVDGVRRSVRAAGEVTQASAAGAEQSSQAAQELLTQAQALAQAVAAFRVDGAERDAAPGFDYAASRLRSARTEGRSVHPERSEA